MESINEFIKVKTSKDPEVFETTCIAKQDDINIYLSYSLFDNDCLFEFSNLSNKVEIKIAKSYFEKYDQAFDLFIEKQSICCNAQSKLYDLISCKFEGIARNIFLESIVLHLLFQFQKNSLVFQTNCDTCSFINKPLELEKIQKAKDFIINNLDQNITISILASFVGTNQCYLKKGFKEVIGQTIFEFLQENRMIKAKHILQNTNTPIQEVSSMVGYSSISSFSQTYKNYFGITPSFQKKQIIADN
jgi:AraC-like DNA-binding protein